jgi:uncharacterized protein YggU (UPF0235/DUF167 family)
LSGYFSCSVKDGIVPRDFRFHDARKGAAITVVVIPGAAKDQIARVMKNGTIKVHLKSSRQAADINRSLIVLLARVLQVPSGGIEVVAGLDGLEKLVSISDLDVEAVNYRITGQVTQAKGG